MTDKDGHQHHNTVPIGNIHPESWAVQKEYGTARLASVFVELLEKTASPFVTAVSDNIVSKAVFFDERLFLVGESLSLFRPHTALSTNQSALHCLLLEQVLTGKINPSTWEKSALRYGRANRVLSNAVGSFGLGGWPLLELANYSCEMISQRICIILGV